VIGGQWKYPIPDHELNSEWEIIQSDIEYLNKDEMNKITKKTLAGFRIKLKNNNNII